MHFIHRDDQPSVNLSIAQSFRLDHSTLHPSSLITFKFGEGSSTSWRFKDPLDATRTYEHILKLYSETV